MAKTIFITGASRGFGKIWLESFLKRGDRVAATSRNVDGLKYLEDQYPDTFLSLQLDITDRSSVFAALDRANEHFGGLDVVINNAGYGVFGMVEEIDEQAARSLIETNILGTLWVTQACLPIFRKKGGGHIIQLSSVLGLWSLPSLGVYSATKFAVEGLSEALAKEVSAQGISVTLVEPNAYATDFGGTSAVASQPIAAYDDLRTSLASRGDNKDSYGDPEATVDAIHKLIDSRNPPLRFFLGKIGLLKTKAVYGERIEEWEKWNETAIAAHRK